MRYSEFHDQCADRNQPLGPIFESMIQQWYSRHLEPSDVVIDGGAYRGRHTIPIARVVDAGRVHAFEPVPHSHERLADAIERAELTNVVLDPRALSDAPGHATFTHVRNAAGYSGLKPRPYPDEIARELEIETLEVECTTIDEYCDAAGVTALAFVKLDLEGGEFGALRGANTVATDLRPTIAFENGLTSPASIYGYERDDFFGWFEAHGMHLLDSFGHTVEDEIWDRMPRPFYFWATPTEVVAETQEQLRAVRRDVLTEFGFDDVTGG